MRFILKFLAFAFLQFASFAAFMSGNCAYNATDGKEGNVSFLVGTVLGLLSFLILFKRKKRVQRV